MTKILNNSLLILGVIAVISALLILMNYFNFPPLEIVNFELFKACFLLIPISVGIIFVNFIIRLFLPNHAWLKWVSLAIIFVCLIFLIGIWIAEGFYFSKGETIVSIIILLIALTFAAVILLIKNRVVRIIANGIVMLPVIIISIAATAIIVDEIEYEYDFYKDEYLAYVGFDMPGKNVVKQRKNIYTSRYRLVNKNPGKLIRVSKKFKESDLNDTWLICNEDGIPVGKNRYYEGELLASLPFVPEYAALITTPDSFDMALSGDKSILMVEGTMTTYSSINIANKKNLTITSSGQSQHASIEAGSKGWTVINLDNCQDIVIKNLIFKLRASPYKEGGIINIRNCKNIEIINNFFVGEGKYLIYIDKLSENITISDCRFENYDEFAIFSEKIMINKEDNEFYRNGIADVSKGLYVKGLTLDNENVLKIIEYAMEDQYSGYFAGSTSIQDQQVLLNFKGGLYDCYYAAGVRDGIEKYMEEDYKIKEGCDYSYCGNLLTLFSKGIAPFIRNSDNSDDTWGWRVNADYREDKFLHVNPRFISWLGSVIDLTPDMELPAKSITLGQIYDNTYQRTFRMFTDVYLYMNFSENFYLDKAIEEYKEVSDRDAYEFRGYLHEEYGNILTDYNIYEKEDDDYSEDEYYNEGNDNELEDVDGEVAEYYEGEPEEESYEFPFSNGYSNCYVSDCIGFWIRRTIDGSAESLYNILRTNMEKFDEEWMREKYDKYGIKDRLSHIPD